MLPTAEQVKELLRAYQTEQLTINVDVGEINAAGSNTAVSENLTLLICPSPSSIYDFVDTKISRHEEKCVYHYAEAEASWHLSSCDELSHNFIDPATLEGTPNETALRDSFEALLTKAWAEEFLEEYPDTLPFSDYCRAFIQLEADELSGLSDEAITYNIVVECDAPVRLSGIGTKRSLTSLTNGAIICGQPSGGGTHIGLKGTGFSNKLAKLESAGHKVYRVTGVVADTSFDLNSYFVEGLTEASACELIQWTDAGLGLLIKGGNVTLVRQ